MKLAVKAGDEVSRADPRMTLQKGCRHLRPDQAYSLVD